MEKILRKSDVGNKYWILESGELAMVLRACGYDGCNRRNTKKITYICFISDREGVLVQWLKLPAWRGGYRGFEPHSGFNFQRNEMFLLRSLVNISYCGEPP